MSRKFGTTLKDVPLFQGTSEGIRPVVGHRFPWPHEDLHDSRGINDDESLEHPEKDYFMLPSNITANRITRFHKFCKELPDVMCNYCSITLYPEDVKWVALEPEVEGALPAACRASAANAHVPGIEGCTARYSRVKNVQQQYAFCSSHSSEKGRQEGVFDDIGAISVVIACLAPSQRRAMALLRMRCCMFKGGEGVGSGYTILKGAAEYVPADFTGAVGRIAIDATETKDIRSEKVNAAVQWLLVHNPLVVKYLTAWDTHRDQLSQSSRGTHDNTIPIGFPTVPCPAGRTGDTCADIQGLVVPSRDKPVPQTHDRALGLDHLVTGDVLPRHSDGPSPDGHETSSRPFPVYYDPYCDPTLTAAKIPVKCLRAKRDTTHRDPTLTAAQIPRKCLRAKRATTHCDPTLTAAQIPRKCLRAKRANTYCDPTLTAAKIPVKYLRAKRAITQCDPTLTAAQIPHKYLRAKRATTHCDPTLTAAQIPHKCLRAKRATTHCDPTLTAAQIHRIYFCPKIQIAHRKPVSFYELVSKPYFKQMELLSAGHHQFVQKLSIITMTT